MGKKKKGSTKQIIEDSGSMECFCPDCDLHFSVAWETIFDLQECTHGYVGYEYFHEEFIACPICGKNANREDQLYSSIQIPEDDEMPF